MQGDVVVTLPILHLKSAKKGFDPTPLLWSPNLGKTTQDN